MRRLLYRIGKAEHDYQKRHAEQFFARMYEERKAKRHPINWMRMVDHTIYSSFVDTLDERIRMAHRAPPELMGSVTTSLRRVNNAFIQSQNSLRSFANSIINSDYCYAEHRVLASQPRFSREGLFGFLYGMSAERAELISPYSLMHKDDVAYAEQKYFDIAEWSHAQRVFPRAWFHRLPSNPITQALRADDCKRTFKHDPFEASTAMFRSYIEYCTPATMPFGFDDTYRRDKHSYDRIQDQTEARKMRPHAERYTGPRHGKTTPGQRSRRK